MRDALLTAAATVVCLVVAEAFGLEHANLAVWTTYLVLAQYGFTRFQKEFWLDEYRLQSMSRFNSLTVIETRPLCNLSIIPSP